jgi:hypothetical protein
MTFMQFVLYALLPLSIAAIGFLVGELARIYSPEDATESPGILTDQSGNETPSGWSYSRSSEGAEQINKRDAGSSALGWVSAAVFVVVVLAVVFAFPAVKDKLDFVYLWK